MIGMLDFKIPLRRYKSFPTTSREEVKDKEDDGENKTNKEDRQGTKNAETELPFGNGAPVQCCTGMSGSTFELTT